MIEGDVHRTNEESRGGAVRGVFDTLEPYTWLEFCFV